MTEMPGLQRRMLVEQNPLLRGAEILFVKRYTYNSKHYYDDFQHIWRWGGNLCVLSPADGQVRSLVPQFAGGVFDRYDLSFDARRIVFGYRRPEREGFRLYEINVDGSGLRRVLEPPADEDRADRAVRPDQHRGRVLWAAGLPVLDGRRPSLLLARRRNLLRLDALRARRVVHAGPLPGLHQPVPDQCGRQRSAALVARRSASSRRR